MTDTAEKLTTEPQTLSAEELAALAVLADGATPNDRPLYADDHKDWAYPSTYVEFSSYSDGTPRTFLRFRNGDVQFWCTIGKAEYEWANASFVAAANPLTIRRLLATITDLQAQVAALTDLSERLKLEAQCHAQEARTANATIHEIYQVVSGGTGEPGNWHGAEPVRKVLSTLRANQLPAGCVDAFGELLAEIERHDSEDASVECLLCRAGCADDEKLIHNHRCKVPAAQAAFESMRTQKATGS